MNVTHNQWWSHAVMHIETWGLEECELIPFPQRKFLALPLLTVSMKSKHMRMNNAWMPTTLNKKWLLIRTINSGRWFAGYEWWFTHIKIFIEKQLVNTTTLAGTEISWSNISLADPYLQTMFHMKQNGNTRWNRMTFNHMNMVIPNDGACNYFHLNEGYILT